jgi:hypothetical protein
MLRRSYFGFSLGSALLVLVAMLLSPVEAMAQFDASAVTGSVRDAGQALLPGATVTLLNVTLGTKTVKTSDSRGAFAFESVPIGDYQVSVVKEGFGPTQTEPFTVAVASPRRVDVVMQVATANETVTVTKGPTLLEVDSSDRGVVVEAEAIVDLPLDGRSYADLVALTPGAHTSAIEDGTDRNREASFNINGQRSTANNFLLDGLDNNSYSPDNQGFSNQVIHPSPDVIAEFKVVTSSFSAEYGRAGGGIINAATKTGTNRLHGDVYEFFRNSALNAWGPFLGLGVKPVLIQNQFGATLGGPIKTDKLFFFGDYEGLRLISKTLQTSLLPTVAQKSGVLTNNAGVAVPITNPITKVKYTNGVIPITDMSNFARLVLASLPDTNAYNTTATDSTLDQYLFMPRNTNNGNKGDIRLDEYLGSKTLLFARGSWQDIAIFNAGKIPGAAGGGGNGNVYVTNKQIALGLTRSLSASSVLDFRLGLTWTQSGKTPGNRGMASLVTQAGIPGLPTDPTQVPSLNYQSISGFSAFGAQISNPALVDPFTINPKVNYTWQKGRHALKVGYEFLALRLNVAEEYPLYGADTYNGQFSRPGSIATGVTQQDYNLADFMFGARAEYQLTNNVRFNYRSYANFAYVQDDWRASSRLTVNMGLRYELVSPPMVDGNHLANFDPSTNTLIQAKDGSWYDRALVHTNALNFAPRLGFAYRIDSTRVFRVGYGISYSQYERNGTDGLLAYNGPYTVYGDVTQSSPASMGLCPAGSNSTTCFRTTQMGYPAGFTDPANFNPANTQTRYQPASSATPYIQSFHAGLQQQLGPRTLMEIAYVGSHGVHLKVMSDFNQAQFYPGAGSTACVAPVLTSSTPCATLASRRRIQGFQDISVEYDKGFLLYNALQVRIKRQYASGLYLLNSFTWGKAEDNAGAEFETNNNDSAYVNFNNPRADKGRSGYDQTLNDTLSVIWQVPFGKGKMFGSHAPRALQWALGGLRLTALNTMTSGVPINPIYTPTTTAKVTVGDVTAVYRPNVLTSIDRIYVPTNAWTKTAYSFSNVYNTGVLGVPDPTSPLGNAGRNSITGPAYWQLDMGLAKQIPSGWERLRFDFRVEAFNALNAVNVKSPDSNILSATYGQVTASDVFAPRRIQLAVKAIF